MPLRRASALRGVLVSILFVWIVPLAQSQVLDCPGATTEIGFKVLFDDISYASAAATSQSVDLNRMAWLLRTKLETLRVSQPAHVAEDPITPVPCAGRRPGSTSDFNKSLVEQLNLRRVVLEVWGRVEPQKRNGIAGHLAFIEYTVIPARLSQLDSGVPPGFYASEHWVSSTSPADEILSVFAQSNDLFAYAHVGAGIKSSQLKEPKQKYDQAFQYLCQGATFMKKEGGNKPDSPQAPLFAYVKSLAEQVLQSARQDKRYRGWMNVESGTASSYCPGVR